MVDSTDKVSSKASFQPQSSDTRNNSKRKETAEFTLKRGSARVFEKSIIYPNRGKVVQIIVPKKIKGKCLKFQQNDWLKDFGLHTKIKTLSNNGNNNNRVYKILIENRTDKQKTLLRNRNIGNLYTADDRVVQMVHKEIGTERSMECMKNITYTENEQIRPNTSTLSIEKENIIKENAISLHNTDVSNKVKVECCNSFYMKVIITLLITVLVLGIFEDQIKRIL